MELNLIGCLLLVPLLPWPEELKKTQSVYDSHLFKHFLQTNASFYNAFIIILFHLLAHSWSEEPQKSYFSCKSYCAEESGNTPYIGCKEQSHISFSLPVHPVTVQLPTESAAASSVHWKSVIQSFAAWPPSSCVVLVG